MLFGNRVKFACFSLFTILVFAEHVALAADKAGIRAVSGRRDMVSGGDALIEITGPSEMIRSQNLSVLANGRNVRQVFRSGRTPDLLLGRVEGLIAGKNTIEVRFDGKRQAALELVNYPTTGPVFSGP